jgi:lysophospholipase L1-like esterase
VKKEFYTIMSNSRFWLLFTGLFPVIVAQGIHTKRTTVRLPEAAGEQFGHSSISNQNALKLVVVGESTVAGVGVSHQQQGLAAQVAIALEQQLAKSVQWFAYGKNGARLADVCLTLLPQHLHQADIILVSIGVNDTIRLSSLKHWQQHITALVTKIRQHSNAPIRFLTLPPMHQFTALPSPLRQVIGFRARALDAALRKSISKFVDCAVIDYQTPMKAHFLAEDGYHPSEAGYAVIGQDVAKALAQEALAI